MVVVSVTGNDWQTAADDIASRITNISGWTQADTNQSNSSILTNGEWIVLTLPTGEEMRMEMTNYEGLKFRFGQWDAASNTWSSTLGPWFDEYQESGYTPHNNGGMVLTDPVQYFYRGDTEGWGVYIQRTAGDAYDSDLFFGCARLNEAWDLSTAAANVPPWTFTVAGSRGYQGPFVEKWNYTLGHQRPNATQDGYVMANPDTNFTNAPAAATNLQTTDKLEVENEAVLAGSHDIWLKNHGGLAHKDTVTTSGADYEVYSADRVWIALKG